ncbi:hypothetical protein [uncultured Deinococcus sp.]|uniref:hypothetical protein n=1 Tax=uncultured Deinococcus sp. TaxID=158789 RepID=UPI00258D06CD|nr:hypothetical protein [uncultured Deinococcus sp.]
MKKLLLPAVTLSLLALAACGPAPLTSTPTPATATEAPAAAGVTLTPYAGLTATERADGVLIVTDDRLRLVLADGSYAPQFNGAVGGFPPPKGTVYPTTPGGHVEVWTGFGWQTVAAWR